MTCLENCKPLVIRAKHQLSASFKQLLLLTIGEVGFFAATFFEALLHPLLNATLQKRLRSNCALLQRHSRKSKARNQQRPVQAS